MHVLITRPEPEADAFRAQLEALGHQVTAEPLLTLEHLPVATDALRDAAGLVVTSRNGLRALGASPAMAAALQLPIIAVGPGTATLARELGFTRITEGTGTATALVPVIAGTARTLNGTLTHVRGEDVAVDLKAALRAQGVELREIVAYRAVPATALRPGTRELLASGGIDAVILMSPRTGAIFARLIAIAGLREAAKKLVFLCLSPAVAASVEPLAPVRVEVADGPNSAALLSAVTRVATLWSGV
jgi:uroporphyrinogen-III synthase